MENNIKTLERTRERKGKETAYSAFTQNIFNSNALKLSI
jgi:hypothetical protein